MSAALTALIARCRVLCRPRSKDPDAELLRRFAQTREAAAFEELLERHASLVWGVCRRILSSEADCEDAFQATFLALVRRAGVVEAKPSLAAWLHTVAVRVARKALMRGRRMRPGAGSSQCATPGDVADEVGSRELCRLVDEEIERLPDGLRLPLVLCCLQGRTRDEAAEALGCSVAAVKSRLERGRELLRRNLQRRGVELPAAFLVVGLTGERIRACLWAKTMQSILHLPAPAIVSLAEASASAATMSKGKLVLAALLVASSAVGAAGSLLMTKPPAAAPDLPAETASKKHPTPQARTDLHGDPLPEGAVARLGTVRFRMSGLVYACALSPDGKIVAASSVDESIVLFEAETGRPLRQLPGNSFSATSLAFAPDSKTLAAGYTNGSIVLWNCDTVKMVRQFLAEVGGPRHPVWSLAFTPDGKGLISAGEDKVVHHWDPETGKEVRRFIGPQKEVRCAVLSSDGKTLASAADDDIRLWETASGKMIRRLTGHKKSIRALAISADGKLLASGDEEGAIHLWETATGAVRHRIRENAKRLQWAATRRAHALAFSPNGQILAVGRADCSLNLWDATTGNVLHDIEGTGFNVYTGGTYHDGGIRCAVFSGDGKKLVFGRDNALAWLDARSGKEIAPFSMQKAAIARIAFRPDGKRLFMTSADFDRGILEWETASGRPIQRLAGGDLLFSSLNCFSSDGKLAATAGGSEVHLWDTGTGKEVRRVFLPLEKFNSNAIQEASFSPDGKRLAVVGPMGNSAWLFDASTGKQLLGMGPGKNWTFVHARFSADSRLVAIVGNEAIQFLDTSSEWQRPSISLPKDLLSFASVLSPDGRTLALASGEYVAEKNSIKGSYPGSRPPGSPPPGVLKVREITLWETIAGKKRGAFPSPCSRVHGLVYSPDGRLLAVAGNDRVVHIWDTVKGEWLRHWQGHQGEIDTLVFSPDGRRLASGSKDTTALIWDVSRLAKETHRPTPLPRQELEKPWSALASADAVNAYRAILMLASFPDQSVPLLAERFRSKPSADAKKMASLLDQLESENFAERERAATELRRLGWEAEPALLKVLENKPSLEARQRVKALLDDIRKQAPPPELLRLLRGIEVLERIGGDEARKAISSLADGTTRAAREAKGALDRQKKVTR